MSTGRRKMRRPRLNADALIEACQDLLDSGALGSKHQQRPHVLVTVDAAEYRAGLGGLLHLPGTDAEPITAATVDQYLCDADVTTILTRPADDYRRGRLRLGRRPLRVAARRGPRGPLRRPHPPHRTPATAQGPRHPRPALRVPRLPRRPEPLRRPPRHRMGRRRTDRPVEHAPALQEPPHPRPQSRLDHHPQARPPGRTTRRLGLHTPTTTQGPEPRQPRPGRTTPHPNAPTHLAGARTPAQLALSDCATVESRAGCARGWTPSQPSALLRRYSCVLRASWWPLSPSSWSSRPARELGGAQGRRRGSGHVDHRARGSQGGILHGRVPGRPGRDGGTT